MHQYSSNNVNGTCKGSLLREEAEHARDTHRSIFSTQSSTSSTPLTSQHEAKLPGQQEIICTHLDVRGRYPQKLVVPTWS